MADWDFYPVKFVGEQTLSLTRFPKSPFPHPFPSCGACPGRALTRYTLR